MQIERINEYALTPDQEAEIAALLDAAFGPEFNGRSYFYQRHHVRFLARANGRLVGHMALCYRDVRLGDEILPIWGLAEVATHPDQRGQGIASALLRDTITFVRSTPAQFYLLFGDAGLYAGNGFATYHNPMVYGRFDGGHTGETHRERANYLMVLPLTDRPWDGAASLDLLGFIF